MPGHGLALPKIKVALLMAENDQLTAENPRLRAMLNPNAARVRAETEQQMQALKGAHASACSVNGDHKLLIESGSYRSYVPLIRTWKPSS